MCLPDFYIYDSFGCVTSFAGQFPEVMKSNLFTSRVEKICNKNKYLWVCLPHRDEHKMWFVTASGMLETSTQRSSLVDSLIILQIW